MGKQIAIIGAGNLGVALAEGLVASNQYRPEDFILTRRQLSKIQHLEEKGYTLTADNIEAVKKAAIVVISVLPQKIDVVLEEIKNAVNAQQLIISLVTGIKVNQIQEKLGEGIPVVRAMPNTALAIRESMTCIATTQQWSEYQQQVKTIFENVGEAVIINEEQMTSATALCACGIAFFLRAIRAASQGGNEIDFHSEEALKMAAQTAKGAASLLIANKSHPEDEIDKVTSPKGCTIAGLNEMEHNGFSSSFIKGIVTSAKQAKELYSK